MYVGYELEKGRVNTNTNGLFEGIFETAIDGIIAIDERGTIESFNPAAERLFGYSAQEAVGLNVRVLMPSPDREAHDGYLENYRRTAKPKIIGSGREVTALRKTGERIPIHLSVSEAYVVGRRVFVGTCRDISELVRARAEVDAARLRSDAVLDTAADGILTIDAQGQVQSFNKAAERLFGYSKEEMLGENVNRLMPHAIAMQHNGYLKHTLQTGERKIIGSGREVAARRRDGSEFPAWLSVSHFRIGERDFFTGIVRDVSELRQQELELKDLNRQLEDKGWFSERQLELNDVTRGASSLVGACQLLIDTLVAQTEAIAAVGYLVEGHERATLRVVAGSAVPSDRTLGATIAVGQGLLGQTVRERRTRLVELEPGQFSIDSSFGTMHPKCLVLIPLFYNDLAIAAFELALARLPDSRLMRYLETLPELCAAILGSVWDQERIRDLLAQSRAQTEELQLQQEETAAAKEQLEEQKVRLEGINAALLRARAELEEKAAALQKTGRYKTEFLTNMSHELRTPLNSILVLAKVMLENRSDNLSAEQVESLRVIAASGTDLLDLINDILDLSKVEAGKLRFEPEPVQLSELLRDLQKMFQPLMEAKRLAFSCVVHPDLPSTLFTDPLRLSQILRNLLSNANKFTKQGSVTLHVRLLTPEQPVSRAELGGAPAILFEVTDTGIGIAPDKQNLIFQAFQQVDSSLNRRFGGTGLGLSISNNLALNLGGELQVQSTEGEGSRFTLILPLRYAFPDAPRTKTLESTPWPAPVDGVNEFSRSRTEARRSGLLNPGLSSRTGSAPEVELEARVGLARRPVSGVFLERDGQLENKTALVVDDDLRNLFALRALLSSRGMQVLAAESGAEALELFATHTDIDVVVMDIMMPHMDGYACMRKLKALPRGQAVPIVALTAKEVATHRRQSLEAGACDIFTKPVDNQALLLLLRERLGA